MSKYTKDEIDLNQLINGLNTSELEGVLSSLADRSDVRHCVMEIFEQMDYSEKKEFFYSRLSILAVDDLDEIYNYISGQEDQNDKVIDILKSLRGLENVAKIVKSLTRIYEWLIDIKREDTVENPCFVTALGAVMAEIKALIDNLKEVSDES